MGTEISKLLGSRCRSVPEERGEDGWVLLRLSEEGKAAHDKNTRAELLCSLAAFASENCSRGWLPPGCQGCHQPRPLSPGTHGTEEHQHPRRWLLGFVTSMPSERDQDKGWPRRQDAQRWPGPLVSPRCDTARVEAAASWLPRRCQMVDEIKRI